MKKFYILRTMLHGMTGYYDGSNDWAADPIKAKRFESHWDAQEFLRHAFTMMNWGGMIAIDEYYAPDFHNH